MMRNTSIRARMIRQRAVPLGAEEAEKQYYRRCSNISHRGFSYPHKSFLILCRRLRQRTRQMFGE